jgi:hypothetical protein
MSLFNGTFDMGDIASPDRKEVDRLTKLLINESRLCQEREIRINQLEMELAQIQEQGIRPNLHPSPNLDNEMARVRSDMVHMHNKYKEAVSDLDFARSDIKQLQDLLHQSEQARFRLQDEIHDLREQLQSERTRNVTGVNISQALLLTQRTLDNASRTKSALRARIEALQEQQVIIIRTNCSMQVAFRRLSTPARHCAPLRHKRRPLERSAPRSSWQRRTRWRLWWSGRRRRCRSWPARWSWCRTASWRGAV